MICFISVLTKLSLKVFFNFKGNISSEKPGIKEIHICIKVIQQNKNGNQSISINQEDAIESLVT